MVLIAIGFAPLGECLSFICLKERHQRKGHPNPQPFGFLSLHSGIDGPALRHVLWRTPKLAVTYMDVGNADFAGAKICQWPIYPMPALRLSCSKGNQVRALNRYRAQTSISNTLSTKRDLCPPYKPPNGTPILPVNCTGRAIEPIQDRTSCGGDRQNRCGERESRSDGLSGGGFFWCLFLSAQEKTLAQKGRNLTDLEFKAHYSHLLL